MSKYVFDTGGSTDSDFFNSVADIYQQQFQDSQAQSQDQSTEQNDNQDVEAEPNADYEDLLSKYQDLEDKLNAYTNGVQAQSADVRDYGDSFLNFLFSDNSDNTPVDWGGGAATPIRGGAASWAGAYGSMIQQQPKPAPEKQGFKTFATREEGKQALIHQLGLYQSGKTRNPVEPDSTLLEAMKVYAPAKDKNDPVRYAQFIAQKLGVTPDTPIKNLDLRQWADAIEQMEGNKGNNPGNIRSRQFGGNSEQANVFAKKFAVNKGLMIGEDTHIDPLNLPQFIDSSTGQPYKPLPTKSRPLTIPDYVSDSDIHSEQGLNWYTDPRTGDVVDFDPGAFRANRFKKPSMQMGGKYKVAGTSIEQHTGLNNPNYDQMVFPMKGTNEFRGLDSGEPVYIEDEQGNYKILHSPMQTAKMVGRTYEKRLQ